MTSIGGIVIRSNPHDEPKRHERGCKSGGIGAYEIDPEHSIPIPIARGRPSPVAMRGSGRSGLSPCSARINSVSAQCPKALYPSRSGECGLPVRMPAAAPETNSVRAARREVSRRRGKQTRGRAGPGQASGRTSHLNRTECVGQHLASTQPNTPAGVAPGTRDNSFHDRTDPLPTVRFIVVQPTSRAGDPLDASIARQLAGEHTHDKRSPAFSSHRNSPLVARLTRQHNSTGQTAWASNPNGYLLQ